MILDDGHSDFEALKTTAGGAHAILVAFDLLHLDGRDLRRASAKRSVDKTIALIALDVWRAARPEAAMKLHGGVPGNNGHKPLFSQPVRFQAPEADALLI